MSATVSASRPQRVEIRIVGAPLPNGVVDVSVKPWANPFRIGEYVRRDGKIITRVQDAEHAVRCFREMIGMLGVADSIKFARAVKALRGKDLACTCPLDSPCHASVLLELANQ